MAERNWRRELDNGAESSRMLKFHQSTAKVRTTASQAAAAGPCPTMSSLRTPLNFVVSQSSLGMLPPKAAASISRAHLKSSGFALSHRHILAVLFFHYWNMNRIPRKPVPILGLPRACSRLGKKMQRHS